MKKLSFLLFISFLFQGLNAQVTIRQVKQQPILRVSINEKHFTDFFFPDSLPKQVLYPIHAPSGTTITRGFPMAPLPGEPTDHPHHLGLWLNFGDVNGLDFWNNSYEVPANKRHLFGKIHLRGITQVEEGSVGTIRYESLWQDHKGVALLDEATTYQFQQSGEEWVIDRFTTLTANIPVTFTDNKEGVFGLRLPHEKVKYINSNGLKDDAVWGKSASWCMMNEQMKSDSISIVLFDHPYNETYPTRWHARGYGLFSANPMGSRVFDPQAPLYKRTLKPGESISFRFRVVIASGKRRLTNDRIQQLQTNFIAGPQQLLITGSYTRKGNAGIELHRYDPVTGTTHFLKHYVNPNASYMALSADRKRIYVLSEEGSKGMVSVYRIDQQRGMLELINQQSTIGGGPCYVSEHAATGTVYVSNYGGGSLTVFKTDANGALLPHSQHIVYTGSSVNKNRQEKPHAHCAVIDPKGKFVYVNDLGTDQIHRHTIASDGLLTERKDVSVDPGNGPRHLVISATGSHAYSLNEMKGTVDVFQLTDGEMKKIQTIDADTVATSGDHGSAAIQLSPDGKWLIASNRITSNQLVVYAIQSDGRLQKRYHQEVVKKPRFFCFNETGTQVLVAGQDADRIQVFDFDRKNGTLKNLNKDLLVPSPVCITLL